MARWSWVSSLFGGVALAVGCGNGTAQQPKSSTTGAVTSTAGSATTGGSAADTNGSGTANTGTGGAGETSTAAGSSGPTTGGTGATGTNGAASTGASASGTASSTGGTASSTSGAASSTGGAGTRDGGSDGAAPGGAHLCGSAAENSNITLTCPSGQTITSVVFASFGTPAGTCGAFSAGACNAESSASVVQALCVGRSSCTVPAANGTFGDPCHNTVKSLSVEVACAAGGGAIDAGAAGAPFKGVANSPCADRTALNVSWYYNWEQTETEPCKDGRGGEFVPMIWGHTGSEQSATGIANAVSSFVSKGYGYMLGFNEPDNTSQANIPVATALSLWPSFDNAAIRVGSPATSANSNGQSWFTSFMSQVNGDAGLRADFIAIHWYGWNAGSCDANASQLESYLRWVEGFAGNRPIWITEWGCLNQSAPDVATVVSFYNGALAVFARHPRVQRYAWYPWSTNLALTNSDGSLTDLGKAYAAAPAYR